MLCRHSKEYCRFEGLANQEAAVASCQMREPSEGVAVDGDVTWCQACLATLVAARLANAGRPCEVPERAHARPRSFSFAARPSRARR